MATKKIMLVLMLQAFHCANGLCQRLGVGLNTRVSHLPRVCRHHAAPPPPPPPRGGGLSLVMSRDDDPKDESHDAMTLVTQGLQNQPVGGSPFAQQQWLGSIIQVFGFLVLAVILHDGMLNVGKGKNVLVPWVKQKDSPRSRCRSHSSPFRHFTVLQRTAGVAVGTWLVIHTRGVVSSSSA